MLLSSAIDAVFGRQEFGSSYEDSKFLETEWGSTSSGSSEVRKLV